MNLLIEERDNMLPNNKKIDFAINALRLTKDLYLKSKFHNS